MRTLIVLVGSLVWLPALAYAQGGAISASLGGRVVDSTGSVLPGVTVTVTNEATNQARTVVTDNNGVYRVYGLTPSSYTLVAELQGFGAMRFTGLVLNVGAVADHDVTMQVASVAESVTVSGRAALVESARTDVSTVVTRDQIEALPTNNRNYLDFTLLTPMSVENFTTSSPQQGIGVNIGGARAKESTLLVDGFWNTDESFGRARIKYSQDAVQEFQVVSLGGAAEYGRAIGGVVSAVTRAGGNDLSGSVYEYYRDKGLNAQTPLEKQRGLPKSNFRRHLFGGSIGGPVVRNRTFFFGAVERTVQDTPADNNIRPEAAAIIGLPSQDVGTLPSTVRGTFVMGKVNHNLTATQNLSGTVIVHKYIAINTEFQSFTARSRTIGQHERDWAYQMQWTNVAKDGRWLQEFKTSFFPAATCARRRTPVDRRSFLTASCGHSTRHR
jgi:Carboxypeptidase regulatory-like domain